VSPRREGVRWGVSDSDWEKESACWVHRTGKCATPTGLVQWAGHGVVGGGLPPRGGGRRVKFGLLRGGRDPITVSGGRLKGWPRTGRKKNRSRGHGRPRGKVVGAPREELFTNPIAPGKGVWGVRKRSVGTSEGSKPDGKNSGRFPGGLGETLPSV